MKAKIIISCFMIGSLQAMTPHTPSFSFSYLPADVNNLILFTVLQDKEHAVRNLFACNTIERYFHRLVNNERTMKLLITLLAQQQSREVFQIQKYIGTMTGASSVSIREWVGQREKAYCAEKILLQKCSDNQLEGIDALLTVSGINLNVTNTFHETPVMLMAFHNNFSALKLLLSHGADAYATLPDNSDAAYFATSSDCISLLRSAHVR